MTISLVAAVKKFFQPTPSEAEKALADWGIPYTKQDDGTIVVEGSLNISCKNLMKLPDLTKVIVKGSFLCDDNNLTSLAGAPAVIGGGFSCSDNQLTSLEGAPSSVGGTFWCDDNQLTSLAFAPLSVGGNFWCQRNQLTSLEGAPAAVTRNFSCADNKLTSLEGAPSSIGESFWCFNNLLISLAFAPPRVGESFCCHDNQLTSLEGAPQEFKNLTSDFGYFTSWDEVSEYLRISPETKEKEKQARLKMQRKIADASIQKQAFKPLPSIRFKAEPK